MLLTIICLSAIISSIELPCKDTVSMSSLPNNISPVSMDWNSITCPTTCDSDVLSVSVDVTNTEHVLISATTSGVSLTPSLRPGQMLNCDTRISSTGTRLYSFFRQNGTIVFELFHTRVKKGTTQIWYDACTVNCGSVINGRAAKEETEEEGEDQTEEEGKEQTEEVILTNYEEMPTDALTTEDAAQDTSDLAIPEIAIPESVTQNVELSMDFDRIDESNNSVVVLGDNVIVKKSDDVVNVGDDDVLDSTQNVNIMGKRNIVRDSRSVQIVGSDCFVSNSQNIVMSGIGLKAVDTNHQTVLGHYNAVDKEASFVIGIGTSDTDRRNSMVWTHSVDEYFPKEQSNVYLHRRLQNLELSPPPPPPIPLCTCKLTRDYFVDNGCCVR